jgi:stress response protein SCP2
VTVGSRTTYCQACVLRINVGGHYTIVSKDAQIGSEDDTHNKFLFRCPNSGEGCEWIGELNQLENHLNPQPTTADNLLDGCQFETLRFKWKRYEVKPLHTQQLQEFKIIVCVTLSLLAILILGGLSVIHSESRALMQHELLAELNTLQRVVDDLGEQMEELRMNYSSLESKYEQVVKESEKFNDERIVDEIIELNQQVNSLILPRYRMPLLSRRQDNYMVSGPFYTKDEGYRMRALAHPKNDGDSLRMVVCLCILQGKYDQTLQWPLNARFTLILYVNESNWKTEEITFPGPSHNSSNDCFTNSTKNLFMIKDGSCVEYEIKRGFNIAATVFHLDIVRKSSWWEFALQVKDFMIHLPVYLWYVILVIIIIILLLLLSLLVLLCFCLSCRKVCASEGYHCRQSNTPTPDISHKKTITLDDVDRNDIQNNVNPCSIN